MNIYPNCKVPVIVSGKRTATGNFMGALSKFNAPELGAIAAKAAMEEAGITGDMIDEVIFGTHGQTHANPV